MPERLHPTVVMFLDAAGQFTRYQHHVAGPPRKDTPDKERVLLLTRYAHGTFVLTFYDGKFRHPSNGFAWGLPLEWAYITWEEVDDTVYGSAGPYQPEAKGLWLYDTLKLIAKFHKLADVQNIIDRLEWGNPEEGAPEP